MTNIQTGNIKWFLYRLAAMSPGEILTRALRITKKFFWRYRTPHYKLRFRDFHFVNDPPDLMKNMIRDSDKIDLLKEADEYLQHKWYFFGLGGKSEAKINWHLDIESGVTAPKKFSFDLNHRDESVAGNIKITWEKNRHHHLTVMAAAYYISGEDKYANEVVSQIESWIDQNPYLVGINWTHPLEQGIRLISWIYCERLLRGSESHGFFNQENIKFWRSVYEHQKFIYLTYSVGSSANNHLIGELAGLYLGSIIWPFFNESEKWRKFSKEKLEKEAQRQTYQSGINRELAFSYQIFVVEFLLVCLIESKKHKDEFSNGFDDVIRNMIDAIDTLTDPYGNVPNYGDGDEGRAMQLNASGSSRVDWIIETGNSLLGSTWNPRKTTNIETILLGFNEVDRLGEIVKDHTNAAFEDAGIFLIRKKSENQGALDILFDAGPLGMGMSAHGHADALSFTLSIDGYPVFIDPGTYCYHTDLFFRNYFRGTSAHNTIVVNGTDQSEQRGPFLWSRQAQTTLEKWDDRNSMITASHDGYKHIGIIHTRKLELQEDLIIEDYLSGNGEARIDTRFHLAPGLKAKSIEDRVEITTTGHQIILQPQQFSPFKILKGENSGGWYSPQFNVKMPSLTLSFQKDVYLPHRQIFSIRIKKINNES